MGNPTVGQTLFSLNVGNAARNCEQRLTQVNVIKVGRKYFTTRRSDDNSGWTDTEYHLDNWAQKSDYCANSCLYVSEEQWLDEKFKREMIVKIERAASSTILRDLSVSELSEIVRLIGG